MQDVVSRDNRSRLEKGREVLKIVPRSPPTKLPISRTSPSDVGIVAAASARKRVSRTERQPARRSDSAAISSRCLSISGACKEPSPGRGWPSGSPQFYIQLDLKWAWYRSNDRLFSDGLLLRRWQQIWQEESGRLCRVQECRRLRK